MRGCAAPSAGIWTTVNGPILLNPESTEPGWRRTTYIERKYKTGPKGRVKFLEALEYTIEKMQFYKP
jgi:hypothetical protein